MAPPIILPRPAPPRKTLNRRRFRPVGTAGVVGTQPIGYELWHGVMKPGYSMSRLVSRVNPSRLTQYGEWTEIYIEPGCSKVPDNGLLMGFGLYILARNDSIVSAEFGSCTFQRKFFNTLTPEDSVTRVKERENHFRQLTEAKKFQHGESNAIKAEPAGSDQPATVPASKPK